MNNTLKKMTILCTLAFAVTGCGGSKDVSYPAFDDDEISYKLDKYDTYYNYIELYDNHHVIYQIGDPFVLRYNGKYYLYSSNTSGNTTNGIPCWESDNMIDWSFKSWVYGDGSSGSGGAETQTAYAPEVTYYKGYFYMCEAPGGQGHYIFRSSSPYGKFEIVSENLGLGIDGSLYVENDQLYIMSAVPSQTNGYIFYTPLNVSGDRVTAGNKKVISKAILNGWTEGPGQFERNGYRYLTYTGNHVNAASYRVAYSYTKEPSLFSGLKNINNNFILLCTGEDQPYTQKIGYGSNSTAVILDNYRGLGHSSNVVGPNLDTEFIAYHNASRTNFDGTGGVGSFNRRYNISQLFTNGKYLTVNGICNYDTVKPALATFSSKEDNMEEVGSYLLSKESSNDIFTAEINTQILSNSAEAIVGYVDANNYTSISLSDTQMKVIKHEGGSEKELGSATITKSDNSVALHTVKVVNGYAKSTVYFDNMLKIELSEPLAKGGKVGATKSDVTGSIQFSNDAYGTADFETVKNMEHPFPAYTYLKGDKRGYKFQNAAPMKDGMRQGENEKTSLNDEEYFVNLEQGDWVKYAFNAPTKGRYSFNIRADKKSMGKQIEVVVDDKVATILNVNGASFTDDMNACFVNTGFINFEEAGIHSIKVRAKKGNVSFSQVCINRSTMEANSIENDLTKSFDEGLNVIGKFSHSSSYGLVSATNNKESLYYFGDKAASNYKVSTNITIRGNAVGFVFRAKNYSYTPEITATESHALQGYYLLISTTGIATLYKYNYGLENLDTKTPLDDSGNAIVKQGEQFKLTIEAMQNVYRVTINDKTIMEVVDEDPFMNGYCGFYTKSNQVFFRDLSYNLL